ncbi:hypothetical protein EYR38_004902 [Pleurotus pulmonarius]|nr:hypothetical protein EYR38_004902 [Pleurotus pulmonarius]
MFHPITLRTQPSVQSTEKTGSGRAGIGELVFGVIVGITVTLVIMALLYNHAAIGDWFAGHFATFAGYFSAAPKPSDQPASTSPSSSSPGSPEIKDE